jgi:hypothetical protein
MSSGKWRLCVPPFRFRIKPLFRPVDADGKDISMSNREMNEQRKTERFEYPVNIEFYLDADIIGAECVDISQTGMCFNTAEGFVLQMRIEAPEGYEDRRARIVWAKPLPGGGTRFGLEFVDEVEKEITKEPDGKM